RKRGCDCVSEGDGRHCGCDCVSESEMRRCDCDGCRSAGGFRGGADRVGACPAGAAAGVAAEGVRVCGCDVARDCGGASVGRPTRLPVMLFSSSASRGIVSASPNPILSLRISAVEDRKSGSSSISALCPDASLLRIMELKVPVAAVHSGFGGGSTKTWFTSAAAGLNSSASSGMESSSSVSNEAGGGRDADGAGDGGAVGRVYMNDPVACGCREGVSVGAFCAGGVGDASGCAGVGCSPVGEAAGSVCEAEAAAAAFRSSDRRASALKTLEQRPQRT